MRISESLQFPPIDPVSPLVVRGKAHELFCARACDSSKESLDRFFLEMFPDAGGKAISPGLHDELCAYLSDPPVIDRKQSVAKTLREFAVYSRMLTDAEAIPQLGESDFADLLLEIHRRLGAGANAFRTGPVRTRPDNAGNQVVYPHHGRCLALIRELHSFARLDAGQNPALCAMATYVGINHAHPFADGNGRTARTAYNLVMAASGSRHFLPIYCFNALSRGGLIIKVRRAMYGGDWEPLLAFFAEATRLSDRLQRQGTLPSPTH